MKFLSLAILLLLTASASAQTAGGIAQSGHFSSYAKAKQSPTK
jgi:hypothetical protein